MALALAEAGAIVYCIDLSAKPDEAWLKVQQFATGLPDEPKGRLEYMSGNVTDQAGIWAVAEQIGDKEGRLDICVCNAGILRRFDCLDYPADEFQTVRGLHCNGLARDTNSIQSADEGQRRRSSVLRASSRKTNEALQFAWQHHHDWINERLYHEPEPAVGRLQ